MAETVTPSVRGRQRTQVELALLGGAVGTAAPAGFIIGLSGAAVTAVLAPQVQPSLPARPTGWIVAVIAAGVVLDVCHLVTGSFRPPTLGRQVPREWGRILSPPVTAMLYGGRLGVGPLTILSTWMWWTALIGAALIGVWTTVAVSVWFAVCRIVVNGVVSRRLARRPESNLAAARALRGRGWSSLTGLAAAMTLAAALLAGCGLPGEPAARPALLEDPDAGSNGETATARIIRPESTTPPPTSPAQLEDFVRTSSTLDATATPPSPAPSPSTTAAPEADEPTGLAALAPEDLAGMVVIDNPSVDRFLSIDDAADIQPDPTEEIALLETRGYRGGWIRAFRSPASDVAVASVYEFADAAEAEFYLEDGLITIGGYGGQFFDIAELPDIRGFQQDVIDDGETVRTLGGAFHRDNRWFLLYVVGSPQTVTPDVLIPALRSWRGELGLQP